MVARLSRKLVVGLFALTWALSPARPGGEPVATASVATNQQLGFDVCDAPTEADMHTWWNNSPYYMVALYIGGASRHCANSRIDAGYINVIQGSTGAQYWLILPTWVGKQMPYGTCQTVKNYGNDISTDPTTAYNQGVDAAQHAYNTLVGLGMDTTSTPVVLDLEAPIPASGTCSTIAKQYVLGWTNQLASTGQTPGLYTSAGGGHINQFAAISRPPSFVWFAEIDSTGSNVNASNYLNSGYWVYSQRHKQYSGGHNETYGGVTFNIDNDCSNGPAFSTYSTSSSVCTS